MTAPNHRSSHLGGGRRTRRRCTRKQRVRTSGRQQTKQSIKWKKTRAPTNAHPYAAAVCTSAELFAVYHSYAFLAP